MLIYYFIIYVSSGNIMNTKELGEIIAQVEEEQDGFLNKASLDTLSSTPHKIVSRRDQVLELVTFLLGYKQGQVAPLVSIYGRSGTGKSTIVQYVCKNMPEINMGFANLRKAKTVFGGANLILNSLDQPSLKSAQGLNVAIEKIQESILESMESRHKLFVLVLDEFDVLFYDQRGNPSDFVYKLVEMQSELNAKGCPCMIITISNNVLADYSLDERVKSRIGTSEIFFPPYTQNEVLQILEQRATEAFGKKINKKVLQRCAQLSHLQHGDARRSVELLRVAAELAIKEKKEIQTRHVESASEKLQKDRVEKVLESLSYHSRIACFAIAEKTFLLEEQWHSTHSLYGIYKKYAKETVSYRRFSDLLKDLENTGILETQKQSKGRNGYNSEFCLVVQPELVGTMISPNHWRKVLSNKVGIDRLHDTPRKDPLTRELIKLQKEGRF